MSALENIAIKYGADKQFEGYTKYYEMFFDRIRYERVTLLEIGVLKGASMRMWEEYFPEGNISGIDIDPACTKHSSSRIRVFIGNQLDRDFLMNVIDRTGSPDVIIDDGGHKMSQQIGTFEVLFQFLKPGGIYVVEDLHTSYVDHFKDLSITTVRYLTDLVDDLNLNGRRGEMRRDSMNYREANVESVCFFKSICFIRKRDALSNPGGLVLI